MIRLGQAKIKIHRFDEAKAHLDEALTIVHDIGDHRGEATALWYKSLVLDDMGDREGAMKLARESLAILDKIKNPRAQEVQKQLVEWDEGI